MDVLATTRARFKPLLKGPWLDGIITMTANYVSWVPNDPAAAQTLNVNFETIKAHHFSSATSKKALLKLGTSTDPKSTSPYTAEQQEKMAALAKENKERKESEKQAKLKAIADERATKLKEVEEEMKKKEKAAEEEAAAEEAKEMMRIESGEGSSGTKKDTDAEIEKKISEWDANLSLGEDEEAESYVIEDEKAALAAELPMERREREDEQKLQWKLRMKREKRRMREEVNKMTATVAKVQECRAEVLAQPDGKAKWDKVLGYLEVLSKAWMEERQASWSQDVALSAMRSGFREFAREIVTHIGGEVKQLRDNVGKYCEGAIEGAKAIAAAEGEGRPRKEPVKLKFPDAYGGVAKELKERMPSWAKMKKESKGQLILVDVEVFRSRVGALIDSGATRSYISHRALKKLRLGLKVQKLIDRIVSVLADNRTMRVEDYVEGIQAYFRLKKDGKVEKVLHSLTLLVQDDLPFDVVLGMDWGEAAGATLHLREHECRLPSPSGEVKTARLFHASGVDNTLVHCCLSAPAFARLVRKEQLEEQVFVVCVRPVTEGQEKDSSTDPTIAKLPEEFKDLTESPTGVVWRLIQHRIEIEPGSRTPKGAVYRMSPKELEELRKQLDELLEKGWIRPSSSPFGAPVLFVPKKEGELRMCIDYRGLNAITVKNAEPLPRIDDLLDRVQGCKYFSKIDLKSGYHQLEVHSDDQYKTAFRTRYGHYEFIVMPFGLANAPTTFQRCMNDLFRPWLDKFVVVYLDDIIVFSKTLQEHQGHLRQVLGKLREANFKINAKKCELAKTQVVYLGRVLDGDGIKPEDSKIAAIRDWPTPRTLTKLRSFLGLANYYRGFVRNFSTIAAPLRRLLKKETIWQWDKDCTSALKKLKRTLIEYPVLKVADPSLPFVVTTDTSQYGIGAVLQQDDRNGYRPVLVVTFANWEALLYNSGRLLAKRRQAGGGANLGAAAAGTGVPRTAAAAPMESINMKEVEQRARILGSDRELANLHAQLVTTGTLTEAEFWQTRKHLLEGNVTGQIQQRRGLPSAMLADVRPSTDGKSNTISFSLTAEIIHQIFAEKPAVHKAYLANVPDKMSEKDFWTKYCRAEYFHRTRTAAQHAANEDEDGGLFEGDQEMISEEAKRKLKKVDPTVNVVADEADDYMHSQGHGIERDGTKEIPEIREKKSSRTIVHQLNRHSSVVLEGRPSVQH
ncbi:hypothetical protein CBR_g28523 [Chara braunii]|uniref:BSD domain-containing protein n=1 Tax=Chara braunii TaxID=69332 RepID=A0A388JWA2_CHABU|nr:hypothetical protein CBR_g28523 [Chara braunii]|eukprot:GBG62047.1 hypothetical protein CBR_g28523 [Chara braunii]